jgi:hypothetical protein
MDELVKQVATRAGISEDQARTVDLHYNSGLLLHLCLASDLPGLNPMII